MHGRLATLIWAMIAYAVIAIPFLMARPHPELVSIFGHWLGAEGVHGKLILFIWVDASMNKIAIVLGPALAGGIIADEKARGSFDLLLAKPIAPGDYYLVKLTAAAVAAASSYLGGVMAALATFTWRVPSFSAGNFLALSVVHLFAVLFSVSFAGLAAVVFGDAFKSRLASIVVLSLLVGAAFLGFYNPALRLLSYANPFFNGVVLIGSLSHYGLPDLLRPIAVLVGFNVTVAVFGRWRAVQILTRA
jgi:ABC-2 type transport system permease protein